MLKSIVITIYYDCLIILAVAYFFRATAILYILRVVRVHCRYTDYTPIKFDARNVYFQKDNLRATCCC